MAIYIRWSDTKIKQGKFVVGKYFLRSCLPSGVLCETKLIFPSTIALWAKKYTGRKKNSLQYPVARCLG
jgi:hypothetical protein